VEHSYEFLKQLYTSMLRIRVCEERIANLVSRGEVCTPCHLYTGQEAVASGLCAALSDSDYISGNHRSHGHFLAKGGSMSKLMSEIFCREAGCSRGRGGSMHLIDPSKGFIGAAPIVAGTVSLAVGAALASSIQKNGRIAVAFFGDGAVGEGVVYEAMNFASIKKLPMIFACENNLYATHMPIRDCRENAQIHMIAAPFGIPSFLVDGNDVLAVYQHSREAVAHCGEGRGPTFIEFLTYRQHGHVGPDDNVLGLHTDIRSKEEIAAWLEKDPIARFKKYLLENNITTDGELKILMSNVESEVEKAHNEAVKNSMPLEEEVLNYVFR